MVTINLGRPTGPRLRDLSYTQEKALDAWLTMALVSKPKRGEDMPVDFTRALATLAKRRGIHFTFASHEMRLKGEAPLGKNIPGCVGGSKRKFSATARPAQEGERVEPWNVNQWREGNESPMTDAIAIKVQGVYREERNREVPALRGDLRGRLEDRSPLGSLREGLAP